MSLADGICWNARLLDKLLHDITVVVAGLAGVDTPRASLRVTRHSSNKVTYRVCFARSLTNGSAIIGIELDIFAVCKKLQLEKELV